MTPLRQQRWGGALGDGREEKLTACETVENAIGGKETVVSLVFRDDALWSCVGLNMSHDRTSRGQRRRRRRTLQNSASYAIRRERPPGCCSAVTGRAAVPTWRQRLLGEQTNRPSAPELTRYSLSANW